MNVKLLALVAQALAGTSPDAPPAAGTTGRAGEPTERVADTQDAPPTLVAPTRKLRTGDLVTIEVHVARRGGTVLDGCTPVELERHTETGWARETLRSCDGTVPAIVVDGTFAVSMPAPRAGQWRASAAWASGCHPGLPLALASCTESGTVRSEIFFVAPDSPLAP
jgi:hypothetical protein